MVNMKQKYVVAIFAAISLALLVSAVHAASTGTCYAHDYDQGVFTASASNVAVLSTHNGVVELKVSDISGPEYPYSVSAYLYVYKDGKIVYYGGESVPQDSSRSWTFSYSDVLSSLRGIAEGQYDCLPIDSYADAKAYWSPICPTCIGGNVLK